MSSAYVARQPIFELGSGLYGYELLYRSDGVIQHADGDRDVMSADVIAGGVLSMGLHSITNGNRAFINFSATQLEQESWTLFEPGSVVIELLETVEQTPAILDACRRMVSAGHALALDDYVHAADRWPLLELASIVKVDVLTCTIDQLAATVRALEPADVRLLAERVEHAAGRDRCVAMGFELFQGYLFSRPETLTRTDIAASPLSMIRLLNLLMDPATTDPMLEQAFEADVALSYKLLRIVNAAAVGGRGVTSIAHAIQLVGRQMLHRWLAVMLVASLGRSGDVSQELAIAAITRARMCELLVTKGRSSLSAGSAFIVGLLSLLDVLLEVPMELILRHLSLSDDVVSALVSRDGPLGIPLQLVESYEDANWMGADRLAQAGAVTGRVLPTLYLDALRWAQEQVAQQ